MKVEIIDEKEFLDTTSKREYSMPSSFRRGTGEELIDDLREVPNFFPDVIEKIINSEELEILGWNVLDKGFMVLDLKSEEGDTLKRVLSMHIRSYQEVEGDIVRIFLRDQRRTEKH